MGVCGGSEDRGPDDRGRVKRQEFCATCNPPQIDYGATVGGRPLLASPIVGQGYLTTRSHTRYNQCSSDRPCKRPSGKRKPKINCCPTLGGPWRGNFCPKRCG